MSAGVDCKQSQCWFSRLGNEFCLEVLRNENKTDRFAVCLDVYLKAML
jgi:hypothetical protein